MYFEQDSCITYQSSQPGNTNLSPPGYFTGPLYTLSELEYNNSLLAHVRCVMIVTFQPDDEEDSDGGFLLGRNCLDVCVVYQSVMNSLPHSLYDLSLIIHAYCVVYYNAMLLFISMNL